MNRITLILATVLSLAFTQVTAQDFSKGVEALEADDFATALKEFKPLAEQGNAEAQNKLGYMYEYGKGVLKDVTEAAKWNRLSAEQGNANGQYKLAMRHLKGEGVLQDYAETLKWLRLSAEQGGGFYSNLAQAFLGIMYEYGDGVLQDNVTAHMWYNIASANGSVNANGSVSADEYRDKLAGLMTASEITKATTMAKECMSSGYKKCGY